MRKKIDIFNIINYSLLGIFAFATLYPIYYVLIGSFTDGQAYLMGGVFAYPTEFSIANYLVVFNDSRLYLGFLNTILRTVIGTIVSLIFTSMVAYGMSRKELRHKKFFQMANIFTMFFSGGLIPFYLLVNMIGLYNNFLVYILPMMYSVYNMIVISAFFRNSPEEIRESAIMDGANEFVVWWRIYIPLSKGILSTVALWIAIGHWNSYMATLLYTDGDSLITLQYYLMRLIRDSAMPDSMGDYSDNVTSTTITYAAMIIAILPIACLYPFIQKNFDKGVTAGSVKG